MSAGPTRRVRISACVSVCLQAGASDRDRDRVRLVRRRCAESSSALAGQRTAAPTPRGSSRHACQRKSVRERAQPFESQPVRVPAQRSPRRGSCSPFAGSRPRRARTGSPPSPRWARCPAPCSETTLRSAACNVKSAHRKARGQTVFRSRLPDSGGVRTSPTPTWLRHARCAVSNGSHEARAKAQGRGYPAFARLGRGSARHRKKLLCFLHLRAPRQLGPDDALRTTHRACFPPEREHTKLHSSCCLGCFPGANRKERGVLWRVLRTGWVLEPAA